MTTLWDTAKKEIPGMILNGLALVTIIMLIGIFITLITYQQEPPVKLSPERQVEIHFMTTLNSGMTDFWKAPTYNKSLSEVAMQYAQNGTNSFKINASSPEEAGQVFDLFESGHSTYWTSTHWLESNQHDHPGASYGIAVFKNGNRYNVSVIYNIPQPIKTVIINDSISLYQPPDVTTFLWEDDAYRPDRYYLSDYPESI